MALQPAAGARDLNPRQVESNRALSERLASVFRLWGYDEVSPPRVERLDTLMAGGDSGKWAFKKNALFPYSIILATFSSFLANFPSIEWMKLYINYEGQGTYLFITFTG